MLLPGPDVIDAILVVIVSLIHPQDSKVYSVTMLVSFIRSGWDNVWPCTQIAKHHFFVGEKMETIIKLTTFFGRMFHELLSFRGESSLGAVYRDNALLVAYPKAFYHTSVKVYFIYD